MARKSTKQTDQAEAQPQTEAAIPAALRNRIAREWPGFLALFRTAAGFIPSRDLEELLHVAGPIDGTAALRLTREANAKGRRVVWVEAVS